MNSSNQWPLPPESFQNNKLRLTLKQRLANWLEFLEFINVVNSTLVALLLFLFLGFPTIHKQARTEAWNVLNSSIDQTGNGGRQIALQNLVTWQKRRESLNWIPIPAIADYLVGQEIDLKGVKANNAFLRKLELKEEADLEYANFSESKFWGAKFKKANLQHVDFRNAILQGADLSEVKLGGANLSGADLSCLKKNKKNECAEQTVLKGADLSPDLDKTTKLNGATLINTDLSEAKLDEVELRKANLDGAILIGAKGLETADWSGSVITTKTIFPHNFSAEDAEANGAYLIPQPELDNFYFPLKDNLININLKGLDLTGVKLSNFNLRYADMAYVKLKDAQLNDADMTYANLEGADLSCVDLSGADLTGANLSGANLSGTNLSNANIKDANLSHVRYSKDTKFPDDMPPYAILI